MKQLLKLKTEQPKVLEQSVEKVRQSGQRANG